MSLTSSFMRSINCAADVFALDILVLEPWPVKLEKHRVLKAFKAVHHPWRHLRVFSGSQGGNVIEAFLVDSDDENSGLHEEPIPFGSMQVL